MDTGKNQCECHQCIKDFNLTVITHSPLCELPLSATKMILCPDCGNKRCPRATNHRNACTRSNEPGQEGSCYGKLEMSN